MKSILPVIFILTACGEAPEKDARHAQIVVESSDLGDAVSIATTWWYGATKTEVAFDVANACSPDRVCLRIH